MTKKRFLFLQGPPGYFFYNLSKALQNENYEVLKIHFNWGDCLFWKSDVRAKYFARETSRAEQYFKKIFKNFKPTDLLIYGDCRELHKIAIAIAKKQNINIHVFEEGYIRPNMITMEDNGVNANSVLIKNKAATEKEIEKLDTKKTASSLPQEIDIHRPSRAQGWTTAFYYIAIFLGSLFVRQNSHRRYPPLTELWYLNKKWLTTKFRQHKRNKQIEKVEQLNKPYFMFAMQLNDDFQILQHSKFESITQSIQHIIKSFAQHADEDDILVLKNHPYDAGKTNFEKQIRQFADAYNIPDRIIYINGGSLLPILLKAKGLVCLNSTSGLQAIHHGIPTKTLEDTIYSFKKLTDQKKLDAFWKNPDKPDKTFYSKFRLYLLKNNQINGSFYTKKGIQLLTSACLKRLTKP